MAKRESYPLAVPTQAWILYHLRFLTSAELMGDLTTFGWFSDGINHLPIALNIDTTETIDVPPYDRLVKHHLEEGPGVARRPTLGAVNSRHFPLRGMLPFGCRLSLNAPSPGRR